VYKFLRVYKWKHPSEWKYVTYVNIKFPNVNITGIFDVNALSII